MLDLVKLALRVVTDAYDAQLNMLIKSALLDLGVAGVTNHPEDDVLVQTAVCTYCAIHFGTPADPERLQKSYDLQKAQLSMNSEYTTWEVANV